MICNDSHRIGLGAFATLVTFIFPLFIFLTPEISEANLYDTPPQVLRPFSALKYPPYLTRQRVQWMLQTMAHQLDQKAFVDFGDHSDFMHVHMIHRNIADDTAVPHKSIMDPTWNPPWENLKVLGSLIHTQEYEGARNSRPYVTRKGHHLSPLERNQILLLADSKYGKAGQVINAHVMRVKQFAEVPHTVRISDLDHAFTGPAAQHWDYSFYFYRVQCSSVDRLLEIGMSQSELDSSSFVEILLSGERACINLMTFRCRNHPQDIAHCPTGRALSPYYTKDGPAPEH